MRFWLVRLGSVAAVSGIALAIDLLARGDLARDLTTRAGLYVILAVSLNLINGITGQFSIGHAAFYMIGAYSAGVIAANYYSKMGLPAPLWLLLVMCSGAFFAAIAGFIVGLPSLKLRGDYLAIVTMGFGEIIVIIALNQKALGQAYGMNIEPKLNYIWIVWLLAFLVIAVSRNLLKNAHGLAFLGVREDEIASAAMGVNVTRTKVTAFVLGSAFAGAAGALYAHFEAFIGPNTFRMDLSFIILTMVVLGGTGSVTGSTLAAITLFYIPEKMRDVRDVRMAMIVSAAIAVIVGVALIKRAADHYHGPRLKKNLMILGFAAGSFGLALVLAPLIANVPGLAGKVDGAKLRFVILAATLVILMLLRPQGVFAHHEFSWSWVKKVFGKRRVPQTAVSS